MKWLCTLNPFSSSFMGRVIAAESQSRAASHSVKWGRRLNLTRGFPDALAVTGKGCVVDSATVAHSIAPCN